MGLAAVLAATGFAVWVTRSITRPLEETMQVADALAEGDLAVTITVDSRDESGRPPRRWAARRERCRI
jgi:methyl-accepting chemotaxis protein